MFEVLEQWAFSCNFFLWECLSLCVLFLYFAEPAYELTLKFGLEFRNSEIYSKDYGDGFFFFFSGNSYFFCKMKLFFRQ